MDKMADQRYLRDRQYRDSSNLAAFRRLIADELQRRGSIHITKDAGLFICR